MTTLIDSLQPFMFYDKNINGAKDYLKTNVNLFDLENRCQPSKTVNCNSVSFEKNVIRLPEIKERKEEIKENSIVEKIVPIPQVQQKDEPLVLEEKDTMFYPKEEDGLFWCFYLMKNGLSNYELLQNRNIVTEMNMKISYIDKLRKDKKLLKTHTHKFESLSHIEGQLSGSKKIDRDTFVTLCFLEQIRVMVVHRHSFYELFNENTEVGESEGSKQSENEVNNTPIYLLCKDFKTKRYGYKKLTRQEVEHYKNTYYRIDNILKPVKAISSYKVDELIDICEKLKIDTHLKNENSDKPSKRKTKQELYESAVQYFS